MKKSLFLTLLLCFLSLSACTTNNSQYESKLTELEYRISVLEKSSTNLAKKIETPIPSNTPQNTGKSEYILGAGNYFVGNDIVPGRYDVEWVSGAANCFVKDDKGYGTDTMTIGEGNGYIKEYKNCILVSGGKIEVKSGLTVKFVKK